MKSEKYIIVSAFVLNSIQTSGLLISGILSWLGDIYGKDDPDGVVLFFLIKGMIDLENFLMEGMSFAYQSPIGTWLGIGVNVLALGVSTLYLMKRSDGNNKMRAITILGIVLALLWLSIQIYTLNYYTY